MVVAIHTRIDFLLKELKYSKDQVDDSLKNRKYDEIMATYMLLATKSSEVSYFVCLFCVYAKKLIEVEVDVRLVLWLLIVYVVKNSSKYNY